MTSTPALIVPAKQVLLKHSRSSPALRSRNPYKQDQVGHYSGQLSTMEATGSLTRSGDRYYWLPRPFECTMGNPSHPASLGESGPPLFSKFNVLRPFIFNLIHFSATKFLPSFVHSFSIVHLYPLPFFISFPVPPRICFQPRCFFSLHLYLPQRHRTNVCPIVPFRAANRVA